MVIIERFFTYGYKLAFIAGGAAGLGKPGNGRWPEDILAAFENALDIGFQGFVIVDRYVFLKIADAVYMLELVLFTVFRELRRAYEVVEYLLLRINRVVHKVIYCALAQPDKTFECRTDDAHTPNP